MSDDLIIKLIWGVMELEQKFEDDPYSLTLEEIKVLSDNEKHRLRQFPGRLLGYREKCTSGLLSYRGRPAKNPETS